MVYYIRYATTTRPKLHPFPSAILWSGLLCILDASLQFFVQLVSCNAVALKAFQRVTSLQRPESSQNRLHEAWYKVKVDS